MSEGKKIQLLIALLLIAAGLYFYERSSSPSLPGGVQADAGFTPLNVQEPALQLDRLRQAQNDEYSGARRNIFTAAPAPTQQAATHNEAPAPFVGPQQPPPPPALQVPVEFYGVESSGGKQVALLKNGDDIIIVGEGDTFLNRFRLLHIGNESAEVEEISTGRHASLALVPPVDQGSGSSN